MNAGMALDYLIHIYLCIAETYCSAVLPTCNLCRPIERNPAEKTAWVAKLPPIQARKRPHSLALIVVQESIKHVGARLRRYDLKSTTRDREGGRRVRVRPLHNCGALQGERIGRVICIRAAE